MKATLQTVLTAVFLLGCARQDPIDRLMAEIPNERVPSYLFIPIKLPHTASAELLVANLTSRGQLRHPKILEIRQTHTTPPPGYGIPVENFTAVLLDTSTRRKIVLFRPQRTNEWYFKIYDTN